MIAAHGALTVRVQSSTLGSTFFSPSILVSLFMGSLSLQTIVNVWQHFLFFSKPILKVMSATESCLAPPLNPDSEAVRHSANLQALISYEHLGVWLFSIKIEFRDIH